MTYGQLLPDLDLPERLIEKLLVPSSTVSVFLGLKDNPLCPGATGANQRLYSTVDHDAVYYGGRDLMQGRVLGCYLTFPTTRDPSAAKHTAEILAWADARELPSWADKPWMRRGQDYVDLKNTMAEASRRRCLTRSRTWSLTTRLS